METQIERPADKVIRLFGGVSAVAELVGTSTVQVHRWTYSKDKGGHDGQVPARHHPVLLTKARELSLPLTYGDLLPEMVEHMAAPADQETAA